MSSLDSLSAQAESEDRNPVEILAEQFSERLRKGESPTISQYVHDYPQYADEIRELFPSIGLMEQLRRKDHSERDQLAGHAKLFNRRPERLGDHEILKEVGRGGMGVVFEARQKSLGRRVALKVLASSLRTPKQLMRFRREATAAARLHHTNIVPVFGVGEQDDLHYYVMQFIDGVGLDRVLDELRTLKASQQTQQSAACSTPKVGASQSAFGAIHAARDLLDSPEPANQHIAADRTPGLESSSPPCSGGDITQADDHVLSEASPPQSKRFSTAETSPAAHRALAKVREATLVGGHYWQSVARIGLQVARALEYAHEQGVLHRDIKPGNLMLDAHGIVWVTDFGLAKVTEHEVLTNSGDIVGTLRYMAPEQFDGKSDVRSDVYSLGLTLYELLVLQPVEDKTQAPFWRQEGQTLKHPREFDPSVPRDLETIVLKATAVDPAQRYARAADLAEDLQRFLDERPILARPASTVERIWRWSRRNPLTAGLTAATLMSLVLVAVVASVSSVRTKLALDRADEARAQAEDERNRTRVEHGRAEKNLNLALGAFQDIIERVASRGVPRSSELDFEEGESSRFDAAVTAADAELLQSLLKFFAELAAGNRGGGEVETALAHRRIGDIRSRLGQFEPAETSYREALALYRQLATQQPRDTRQVVAQAEVLNSLGDLLARQGQISRAIAIHEEAQEYLSSQPAETSAKKEVRFALAQTLNAVASVGPRSGIFFGPSGFGRKPPPRQPPDEEQASEKPGDAKPREDQARDDRPRDGKSRSNRSSSGKSRFEGFGLGGDRYSRRPPQDDRPPGDRTLNDRPPGPRYPGDRSGDRPPHHDGAGPPHDGHGSSLFTKVKANHQLALELLTTLVKEEPANAEFRMALAHCYRNHLPFSWFGDDQSAELSLTEAVRILDELVGEHPGDPKFRFELVDTLSAMGAPSEPRDQVRSRLERAARLSTELCSSYVNQPDYRAQCAMVHAKLSSLERSTDNADPAAEHLIEAITLETRLVEQFSTVPAYHFALARWRRELGDVRREQQQYSEAQAVLEEGIRDFEAYQEASQIDSSFSRHMLASLYFGLADALRPNDEQQSRTAFHRALEIDDHSWSHGYSWGKRRHDDHGDARPRNPEAPPAQ